MNGERWMVDAACRAVGDPDLWFPERGANTAPLAKQVCGRCPVAVECEALWQSMPNEQQRHGVWAGRTLDDRGGGVPAKCGSCGEWFPRRRTEPVCPGCVVERRRESRRRYERSGRRR